MTTHNLHISLSERERSERRQPRESARQFDNSNIFKIIHTRAIHTGATSNRGMKTRDHSVCHFHGFEISPHTLSVSSASKSKEKKGAAKANISFHSVLQLKALAKGLRTTKCHFAIAIVMFRFILFTIVRSAEKMQHPCQFFCS